MRALLVPALVVVATGCASFGGRLPPLELYRLASPIDSAALAADGTTSGLGGRLASGGIAIAPYATPGIYGERGIVYRINGTEYGTYPYREWALPLGTMLGLVTQDILRARPVSAESAVFDPPSRKTYAYVWRGLVRELEEVDRDRAVLAAVRLEVRLVRASDDSVLWMGSARLERPVPDARMPAIVDSLSRLAADVVGRLADEARAALARPAASAVRSRP